MTTRNAKEKRMERLAQKPADTVRLSRAVQELDEFFNVRSMHWREPIPVWLGMAMVPQLRNWEIVITEYRRVRAELAETRYTLKKTPKYKCRRRIQPLVRMMLNV